MTREHRRPLILWGGTIGFGFGALIDVFVFHLIFQHHHILSGIYDPTTHEGLRANVMMDGIFSMLMLGIVVVSAALLWRTVNRTDQSLSTLALVGSILVGMGVFNVFDGVVNHYVLDLHHVVHGTEVWNPHWVVVSVVLLGIGLLVLLADRRRFPEG